MKYQRKLQFGAGWEQLSEAWQSEPELQHHRW